MDMKGASRLVSVGYYLPETRVTTQEMLSEVGPDRFNVTPRFIEENVGVREVRHAADHQRPSELAIRAAQNALEQSDIDPGLIDLIIFCGIEGDYTEPATAHFVQAALGLKGYCFDVRNACLGFTTALQIANALIAAKDIKYALVCTGETLSRLSKAVIEKLQTTVDAEVFKKLVGFLTVGDAGGAALLGPKEGNRGFLYFNSVSKGEMARFCYYSRDSGDVDAQMVMDRICASGLQAHRNIFKRTLAQLEWAPDTIDCLVTHQVGSHPFVKFSEMFSVSTEHMTKSFDYLGNLTTATMPVNLALGKDNNLIKPSDHIFAAMSGSGLSICQFGMVV